MATILEFIIIMMMGRDSTSRLLRLALKTPEEGMGEVAAPLKVNFTPRRKPWTKLPQLPALT